MTILIRKYYNQAIAFDHRRIWLQKEKQKRELRKEELRKEELRKEELQNPNQGLRKNQRENLKEIKNLLVDTQLAFLVEQKLLKKFLAEVKSLQVK